MSLLKNKKLTIIKSDKNKFNISFRIINEKILLNKMIDFHLIKFMYDINLKFFDCINLKILNNNEANIFILMKDLFKKIGISQRYIYLKMTKDILSDKISFICFPIEKKTNNDFEIPNSAIHVSIKKINIHFDIINDHEILFNQEIIIDENIDFPIVLERIFIYLLKNIFKNVIKVLNNLN